MEVEIVNISGKKTGKKAKLKDSLFAVEPNDHAIYLDVKQHLANRRQGTHKSKEKNEVAYSTRKLKRQKGTGGARSGSRKSPVFVGGGRVFGPKPRDYSFKLNKKLKDVARKSALSYKAKENNIVVIEDFTFESPKTKNYKELLKNLKLDGEKTLLVLADHNKNIFLSSRNLQGTQVMKAADLNTYDVLNATSLVLAESSVKEIEKVLKN